MEAKGALQKNKIKLMGEFGKFTSLKPGVLGVFENPIDYMGDVSEMWKGAENVWAIILGPT